MITERPPELEFELFAKFASRPELCATASELAIRWLGMDDVESVQQALEHLVSSGRLHRWGAGDRAVYFTRKGLMTLRLFDRDWEQCGRIAC